MSKNYTIEYKGLEKRASPLEEAPKRKKQRVVQNLDDLARVAGCMDEWTRRENIAYEKELKSRKTIIEHLHEQYNHILAKYCVMAESIHDMSTEIQMMQTIIDHNVENYNLQRYIIRGPYDIPQCRVRYTQVPNFRIVDQSDTESEDLLDQMLEE